MKKYERGDLPKSDWLDKMAFRKMEEIHAVSCGRFSDTVKYADIVSTTHRVQSETEKSENLFLYIDLPRFDFPVIFSEPVSPSFTFTGAFPESISGRSQSSIYFEPDPHNYTDPRSAIDILCFCSRLSSMGRDRS